MRRQSAGVDDDARGRAAAGHAGTGESAGCFLNSASRENGRLTNMLNRRGLPALSVLLALALAPILAWGADDERRSLEELRNTVVNLLQALVDQGVITREKAQQMVKSAQDKAAADAAAVAKADEGAVRVPYVPQIVKDEIAKQVAEEVKPAVVADVVKDAKLEKWGVPAALPEWLSRVKVYGD